MRLPRSLQARLVITAVALVVGISVLIGIAASVAMDRRLTAQVDDELHEIARRFDGPRPGGGGGGGGGGFLGNISPDSIFALFPDDGEPDGTVAGRGPGTDRDLSTEALKSLDVQQTDAPREVDVPGLGAYRVVRVDVPTGEVVVGLPIGDVDDAVSSLLGYELLLVGAGAVIAAAAGVVVVRRQLRPLRAVATTAHDVAALPLSSGEVDLAARVPESLTDVRTEVGQVGAALNTLLDHVESSLDARHQSEQQVRQFVADASHELRTPLATIAGYTELARGRPDDPVATATALGKVADESRRMTSLVEDLLLLARLDSGRPLEQEPVDLTRLLLEAVSDARVLGPDHHWRLELPDESVEVVGDEQRLHQVITNLLTNARKYTPPGTTITVAAQPAASGPEFSVHDTGPGFPPGLQAKAFERFVRGDVARHREGGAGLGLAMVQAIVAAHGGQVSLDSRPGDTTVRVSLR